jgi:hypothetical protein
LLERQESKICGDWQAHLKHITVELCGRLFQQAEAFYDGIALPHLKTELHQRCAKNPHQFVFQYVLEMERRRNCNTLRLSKSSLSWDAYMNFSSSPLFIYSQLPSHSGKQADAGVGILLT